MTRTFADLRTRLLPIALAQGAGFLCGVAGVKLNSQLVAPEDFGRYGVFLTFAPLGMWVIHAGLVKLLQRQWASHPAPRDFWRAITTTATRRLPWLAAASLVGALLTDRAGWVLAAPLLFIAAAALSYATLATVALQAERRHWEDFSASLAGSLTRSFLPPLLYVFAGGVLGALYAGFALHAVAFAGIALWLLRPRAGSGAAAESGPLPPTFTGPMFNLLAIVGWALLGLNRWIAASFFGPEFAGYFTLASNVALFVPAMLGTMFMQYFLPDLVAAPQVTESDRRALAARLDRIALLFWLAALAGLGAVRLVLPLLVGPLIDQQYADAAAYVVPAGCFFVAVTTTLYYQQLLIVGRREQACGPVETACAAVLVIGGVAAATAGAEAFRTWLLFTPLAPWLVTRPLARRAYFAAAS